MDVSDNFPESKNNLTFFLGLLVRFAEGSRVLSLEIR